MPYIQIVVTPHFYWELVIDDVLQTYGQAHDETSAIDAATIASRKYLINPITIIRDYIDQS
jgi:hypothetical protein